MAAGSVVQVADWSRLRDAYGTARDLPILLERLRHQTGPAFEETLGELCSRIWYNGTIFPATSHATRALGSMLDTAVHPEKTYLYEVLAAVAESAREAVLSTPEQPCAAGTHDDGLAVLRAIFADRARFRRDLDDRNAATRRLAARLLVACDDVDTAIEIRELFLKSIDPRVRSELLAGLLRLADRVPDWPQFIAATLITETDPESRFLLRCAEFATLRNDVSDECVNDLVRMFIEANQSTERGFTDTCGDPDQFVQAIGLLSLNRQVDALCAALKSAPDENLAILLAERLLRLVFRDRRKNWGEASYRMVNLDGTEQRYDGATIIILKSLVRILIWPWFAPLRNRWPRDHRGSGVPYIEYAGLEGSPPTFEAHLTPAQQTAVLSIARHDPLWRIYTNLWELFALPSNRREMEEYGIAGE
ncbi:MAG TPA: hypothetical protein VGL53_05815 [Bryobacteraceae bacterium]